MTTQSLIKRTLILSGPWDLLGSQLWIIFFMPFCENVRVTKSIGSLLLFCIIEHCSAKKELKTSAFCLKSVPHLSLWYSGWMIGIFLSFQKLLRIDQKALGLVLEHDSFVDNFKLYLLFAFSLVDFKLHKRDLIVSNLVVFLSLVRYNL